jgi:hypothetical protein
VTRRAPFYVQAPTPAEVRAAWAKARPGLTSYQRHPFGILAREFFQGVISEHLRQEVERAAGSKLYRKLTAAERRAIDVTRAWLEFGDCLGTEDHP